MMRKRIGKKLWYGYAVLYLALIAGCSSGGGGSDVSLNAGAGTGTTSVANEFGEQQFADGTFE